MGWGGGPCDFSVSLRSKSFFFLFWGTFIQLGGLLGQGPGLGLGPGLDNSKSQLLCLTFCRISWNRRMRLFWASFWRQHAADSRPPQSLSVLLCPDLGVGDSVQALEPFRQNQDEGNMKRNVRTNEERDPIPCMLGYNNGKLGLCHKLQHWPHSRCRRLDVLAVLAIHIVVHAALVLSLVSQKVLYSERSK